MHVNSETLLTTREMFYLLSIKEYGIKYYRIPIIENNPPSLVLFFKFIFEYRRLYLKLWIFLSGIVTARM